VGEVVYAQTVEGEFSQTVGEGIENRHIRVGEGLYVQFFVHTMREGALLLTVRDG